MQAFVDELKTMPIAIQTATANEQHYEIPTSYFLLCLGKHLKYSSCLYPKLDPTTPLYLAEEAMLGEALSILSLTNAATVCHHQRFDLQWNRRAKLMLAHMRSMLLCCLRAELVDGQEVLELGCGWGSLCLYVAAKYPNSRVTAVSNSRTQKEFIDKRCRERGLSNLRVMTADVVKYEADRQYDRVLSVEMFEHMKNYKVRNLSCIASLQDMLASLV